MKIQLNNGLISDLPLTAIVATGVGDIEIQNLPENPFDYDYIDGQLIRMRWSDWHEQTNFQIRLTEKQLRYLFLEVPAMVMDFKSLEDYEDMMGNIYFYVNELSDEDRQLIENFGGVIESKL